jgi:hypothetical protein
MIEHGVNVDRSPPHRPLVAEYLHAIDQRDDAVRLVADQSSQHSVVRRRPLFEKLRRTANAGERVLDLVREHGRKRNHRARRAAMGQLPIHLVSDGALLDHHHHVSGPFRQGRDMQVDLTIPADPRRAEIDPELVYGRTAVANLIDQGQERTAEWDKLLQWLALQELLRHLEEGLCRDVGVDDPTVGRDQQHRVWERVENGLAIAGRDARALCDRTHAAALHAKSSNASTSDRCTPAGSSAFRIFPRHVFKAGVGTARTAAAVSSAQPRCFRA